MKFTLRFAALALILAACTGGTTNAPADTGEGSTADATNGSGDTGDLSDGTIDDVLDGSAATTPSCQPILGTDCLAPWPSAYWETPQAPAPAGSSTSTRA